MKDQYVYPSQIYDAPNNVNYHHPGLTLRQHYAGEAMKGLLANPNNQPSDASKSSMELFKKNVALSALAYADALIAAEKESKS